MAEESYSGPQSPAQSRPQIFPRACQECHRKKTKCDMTRPVCGLCRRTGSECHFPTKRRQPSSSKKHQKTSSHPLEGNLSRLLSLLESSNTTQLIGDHDFIHSPSDKSNKADEVNNGFGSDESLSQPGLEQMLGHSTRTMRSRSPYNLPQYTNEKCNNELTCMEPEPERMNENQRAKLTQDKTAIQLPYELVIHLVETFFLHIQPWLPLIHKPRFLSYCTQQLKHDKDALAGLPADITLLLYSLFALSARYSDSPCLAPIRPLDRDKPYLGMARQAYADARSMKVATLTYLQGCILLAFATYTSELDTQGWILTGVCVRLAYELDLSEIDGEESQGDFFADLVEKEERRRAWWCTWELDTFGSMVSHRPFAIDRHHYSVNLPVSDEAWFAGDMPQSSILLTSPDQCWMSLQNAQNQDTRAWFLVANNLLSLIYKQLQGKSDNANDSRYDFEVALNCLKLSLPPQFNIFTAPLSFEPNNFTKYNWIMGTHLILGAAQAMVEQVIPNDGDVSSPLPTSSYVDAATCRRATSLTKIITRWPIEYMTAAHPFFVCMMLPNQYAKEGPVLDPVGQMIELILKRFTEKWKLASEVLAVLKAIRESNADLVPDFTLAKRYAAFFPRRGWSYRTRISGRPELNTELSRSDHREITVNHDHSNSERAQSGGMDDIRLSPVSRQCVLSATSDQSEAHIYSLGPFHQGLYMLAQQEADKESVWPFSSLGNNLTEHRDFLE